MRPFWTHLSRFVFLLTYPFKRDAIWLAEPSLPLPLPLQLQQQSSEAAAHAAAIGVGPPVTYQPGWKPFPFHAWPYTQSSKAKNAQAEAVQIETQDAANLATVQTQMKELGC